MRRGYLTPPVLIILAIIIFFVAIVLAINTDLLKHIKKEPFPTTASPSPTTQQHGLTPDAGREPTGSAETSNWKAYLGSLFSFKYPSDWTLSDEDISAISLKESATQEGASLIVYSVDNPKKLTIEQAVTISPNEGGICCISRYLLNENVKRETLTMDGLEAKRFINTLTGVDNVYILREGKLINISNNYGSIPKQTFDQILSTFKFLD